MIGPLRQLSLAAAVAIAATAVARAQYDELSLSRSPSSSPTLAAPTVIPPASAVQQYETLPVPGNLIGPPPSDDWCLDSQPQCRTSSWTAAIELVPSGTLLTDGEFGRWPDDGTLALRFLLGYEDPNGYGVRARLWGLSQDSTPPAGDVTLSMGSFSLDLYKRVFFDHAEVAFGAGPTSGGIEFELSDNTYSEFTGGGGSIFFDGFYGIHDFERAQLGTVARARYSLLMGDWRDTTGGVIVPDTDNDTMSVVEIAWGLEYRRRFGPCEDHNWFLGLLVEYQRWQSDWMSNFSGTSIGVAGLNIYTGFNW